MGSSILTLVLALVAAMARQLDHRPPFVLVPGELVSASAISIPR